MQIEVSELEGGAQRIALSGRLDVSGVDAVEPAFHEAVKLSSGAALVDMSQVAFVASLGLRMFVAAGRERRAAAGRLILFGCQPAVAEVFEMAAVDDLVMVKPNEAAALGAMV